MKNNYLKILFLLISWLFVVACFNGEAFNQWLNNNTANTNEYNNNEYSDEAYADEEYSDDEYADDEYSDDESDSSYSDEEDGNTINLVRYTILNHTLDQPDYYELSSNQYGVQQNDTALHQNLWRTAALIFPDTYENKISQVVFSTDGRDNDLASVEPAKEYDTSDWILYIDVLDATDTTEYTHTLTHELGHLLTLKTDQFESSGGYCDTLETDYGCFSGNSYIAEYIDQFWTELISEWQDIEYNTTTQEEFDSQIEDFYNLYSDQFVDDYAATHPEEDFAETWTYFVFELAPDGGEIAQQKIDFFENYPELVQIKQEIRKNFK